MRWNGRGVWGAFTPSVRGPSSHLVSTLTKSVRGKFNVIRMKSILVRRIGGPGTLEVTHPLDPPPVRLICKMEEVRTEKAAILLLL